MFNKIKIKKSVGNNLVNQEDDVLMVKRILSNLQRLSLLSEKAEPHGYVTREMDQAIKSYQKEKGIKIDGLVFPNGETQANLNADLKEKQTSSDKMPANPPPTVEREELKEFKPKLRNIPGTNIPDKSIPETGVAPERGIFDPYGDDGRYRAIPLQKAKPPNPSIDPKMELPYDREHKLAPWEIYGRGWKI